MSAVDPISAAQDDAAHLCLSTLVWWDNRMASIRLLARSYYGNVNAYVVRGKEQFFHSSIIHAGWGPAS